MPGSPSLSSAEALSLVVAEVRELLEHASTRLIVGVTGPPGSGKSTFARRLAAEFADAAYLPMDGFHLSNAQLARLGRGERKGAPDTFDVDGYVAMLSRIADAQCDVYVPGFDRALEEPVAAAGVVPARCPLVVTEGNYLALPSGGWAAVRPLIDRLYYLDCPAALRRQRLLARHAGRGEPVARHWVDTVDEPNARLIADTRPGCDRVLYVDEPADPEEQR